nr:hypothetical protein [Tanacetum cinerariifolium]
MSTIKFAKTHNLVAFLEKPAESKGFEQIVDFLNANPNRYALTVNPTIYTSWIQQFWDSSKVKTVNEDVQIRDLVDEKKIIVTEASIRRDLQLQDAEGIACLPNDTIFEELARMSSKTTAWNEFSSTMASAIICLAKNQKFNFSKYIFDNMVFANKKREGKGFSRIITPLFETMMVQAPEEVSEGSEVPTDTHHTPTISQPSSSQPQKKQKSRRKQRQETEVPHTEPQTKESVPTTSNDPLPSGEDRMQLTELMNLCTNLQKQVLDLEKAKTAQAKEIVDLKKRVKKLERNKKSMTSCLKRLWNIGSTARGRINEEEMFRVNDIDGDEVIMDVTASENVEQSTKVTKKDISIADPVTTAGEVVTTAEIKVAKPKTRGVIIQEPSKFRTTSSSQPSQLLQANDKAGSENRPPMLNKKNYVLWSSRLLRYAKSRPNGKLIHNSIINGSYVRRMIPEPGDPNHKVPMNETFHVQTNDELTEKELKQIEADDQAIQTILLDLPEDIYAAVDSCETAQEIWLCVQQMTKCSDIGIQDKKAKLFNEWERFTSTDGNRLSLTIINYMQQPMPNPEDIIDPTAVINMELALMAKAFKLNYSTPTNNNQRISSNPRNRHIAQPGMNMGQDRQMQMVRGNGGNQFRQYAGQNLGNLNGYNDVQNVRNQNLNGNGNLVAAWTEGNVTGHNADLDEIEEVNANCILMDNLQQASTSGTQTDKAPIYDSDRLAEYTELLKPIPEPHQVPQNNNNVISEVSSVEQSGETVEQHPANVDETHVLYDSLYNNLAIEVEKVSTVNRKLSKTNAELTTKL